MDEKIETAVENLKEDRNCKKFDIATVNGTLIYKCAGFFLDERSNELLKD